MPERDDLSYTLHRTFAAPRDAVFRAWTDPAQLGWFLNPGHLTDVPITVDLRVGGAWRLLMVIDDETSYMTGGIYREIVPNERIVFTWGQPDGWPEVDPENPDENAVIAIDLRDGEDGTTVMDFHVDVPAAKFHPYMKQGWNDTVDRLVAVYGG